MDLCTLLNDANWLHNCDGCAFIWFTPDYIQYSSKIHESRSVAETALLALHFGLRAMLGFWNRHCTSAWICMNMAMSPWYLPTEYKFLLYAVPFCWLRSWLLMELLRDIWYVRKLVNLIYLARRGSHSHLEERTMIFPQTSSKNHLNLGQHLFKSTNKNARNPWRHNVVAYFSKFGNLG